MKLILIRHGLTEDAIRGIGQRSISKLSRKGVLQSKKLAKRLKKEKIDLIFSSDYKRAIQTAKEIGKFHKAKIIKKKELREFSIHKFQGKPYDEFDFDYDKLLRHYFIKPNKKTPRGESFNSFKKRTRRFYNYLHNEYHDKTIVVVTHGHVITLILSILLKKPKSFLKTEQHNTGLNLIEFDEDKKHKIHLINDTSHLDEK